MKSLFFSLSLLLCLLISCGRQDAGNDGEDSADASRQETDPSSYVVDSAYYTRLSRNPAPLTGGHESIDAVVQAALDAFKRNDTTLLKNALITREEYLDILYPELGMHWSGARDMRPEIKGILWETHAGNAMKGLRRALRDLGGRTLILRKVEFADGRREYVSYSIHEGTLVTVKDETGNERKLGQIGAIVEKDGIFKLLAYKEGEPE